MFSASNNDDGDGRGGTHKVGVAEDLARDERDVRLAFADDRLNLLGRRQESDGADEE